MEISADEIKELGTRVLTRHGMKPEHADMVLDHLIDAAMSGHAFAGPPRIFSIVEMLRKVGPGEPIRTIRESASCAVIDGGGVTGYVTSLMAIDKAVALAKETGVGIVGVHNSWFSGRLSYYVDRAARAGMVAIHTASSRAVVAPHGSIDKLLGTNPVSLSFPADGDPLVIDFGTSAVALGEVLLRQRSGRELPEDTAVDEEGLPTTDPSGALAGAMLAWGGPRGSALSIAVQIFGALAGGAAPAADFQDSGFFFLVFDPAMLMPADKFKTQVSSFINDIKTSRPAPGQPPVRIPGEHGHKNRREGRVRGKIDLDDKVYAGLLALLDD
ncbi:Ldh family oxidoreductase [Sphingobium phenoxybenzoativorans]|uniref:Ldh family oxidoreductase n=1 Tax=Sphingobium phenoxybenzoativorans TaxID=1592790 RepID=A0A975Q3A0_9SPHN|nr:Ldh family oxidoreductase [Sphingobium phenoxybenzoativorans]QUT07825.1 Ldh family oxidoreductase [Sphingobium phenoxybenzoativorans]